MEHAERKLGFVAPRRTASAWELVRAVDVERASSPAFSALQPAAIYLTTADGAFITFRSLTEAAVWVGEHADEPADEIMARWTQDGQNSTAGQSSVTIRVSSAGFVLVTGPGDEVVADFEARVQPHLPA